MNLVHLKHVPLPFPSTELDSLFRFDSFFSKSLLLFAFKSDKVEFFANDEVDEDFDEYEECI